MAVYSPYQLRIRGLDEHLVYRLPAGRTRIGRNPGNEVVLTAPLVSEWHAELTCQQQGDVWHLSLLHLGSSHGTSLNAEPILRNVPASIHALDGAVIQIAGYTLRVELYVEPPREQVQAPPDAPQRQRYHRLYPYPYAGEVPLGLSPYSRRFLPYLPSIYQPAFDARQTNSADEAPIDPSTDSFLSRFLALFESVLLPIESVIDHFDLYLDPKSTPREFLPWLEAWFRLPFFADLTEAQKQELQIGLDVEQRRKLLEQAHDLFERKGTRAGLQQLLQLFCQHPSGPDIAIGIDDLLERERHFVVTLTPKPPHLAAATIKALIEAYKPVHTTYELQLS